MSIAGSWDVILNTPMGKQKGKMTVTLNGDEIVGEIQSPMGNIPMKEGKLDGDKGTWLCGVTKPISMNLEFDVLFEGDAFTGTVKVGPMGKNVVEGKRAS
ncbi:hypothetical protein [Zhongshania aquimaris]|uniref:Uncharacterized protein n=1 Tax=Zhongshania aquimaris TaxID=2857107 RepID=A0ABS6VSS0_9GAMM|nr:hypothetical protein [Zhongshania aquimaris]MBW2941316.1 hypothetical protein [Zhongshania aquimaris]